MKQTTKTYWAKNTRKAAEYALRQSEDKRLSLDFINGTDGSLVERKCYKTVNRFLQAAQSHHSRIVCEFRYMNDGYSRWTSGLRFYATF